MKISNRQYEFDEADPTLDQLKGALIYWAMISSTPRLALATDDVNGYSIAKESENKSCWTIIDTAPTKEKALFIAQLNKTSN